MAPIAYAVTGGAIVATVELPLLLSGHFPFSWYVLIGTVLLKFPPAYAGTVALGMPGYFILQARRRSGWRAYAGLGVLLGAATGIAEFWWTIGSRLPAPSLWVMPAMSVPLLSGLAGAALAGAIEGVVFWAIAQPARHSDGAARIWARWPARIAIFLPALALLAALLAPGMWRVYAARIADRRGEAFAAVPHPVWDSGIYPGRFPVESIHFSWVDDNTLLFTGWAGPNSGNGNGNFDAASGRIHALYVWRVGAAPRTLVAAVASVESCAADGRVSYSFAEKVAPPGQEHRSYMAGRLGEEQAVAALPTSALPVAAQGNPSNDARRIDSADCGRLADPAMAGRAWVTDTSRQYRLDFGPVRRALEPPGPVTLMRADGSLRVALPIAADDVVPYCTQFHRFDGAFLVWDCATVGLALDYAQRWQAKQNCWPVWRIEPATAAVNKICLPFGDWVGSAIELVPTKAGLLFTSQMMPPHAQHDAGAAGLYEFDAQGARRILAGFIVAPAVSPSGCKVAFYYVHDNAAYADGGPGAPTVAAIDLCAATPQGLQVSEPGG